MDSIVVISFIYIVVQKGVLSVSLLFLVYLVGHY